MENIEHTKYTRLMLLVLAVVLLSASIIGYVVSQRLNDNQKGEGKTQAVLVPSVAPTLIPYPVKGSFVLKEKTGKSIKLGTLFTIDLLATSSKDTVAGYDVVLSYDTDVMDSQLIENKNDSFRIFTYKRANHLSISATKNLTVTQAVRFSQTPILSFAFVAKKKGTFTFSLKPVGNESSKLVNEAAAVTYPETNDIRLEIN